MHSNEDGHLDTPVMPIRENDELLSNGMLYPTYEKKFIHVSMIQVCLVGLQKNALFMKHPVVALQLFGKIHGFQRGYDIT